MVSLMNISKTVNSVDLLAQKFSYKDDSKRADSEKKSTIVEYSAVSNCANVISLMYLRS